MCGLIAVFSKGNKPVNLDSLSAGIETLSHRGPDDQGLFVENFVGLGHTRLAIQDPTASSKQPMVAQNDKSVMIYNGEIYNVKEMSTYLKNRGTNLLTKGDTEVVLESLALAGPSLVSKFNGMFSFIYYDKLKKKIIVARDRYGTKPLYYYLGQDELIFASEIKAILKYIKKSYGEIPGINTEVIREYIHFQNVISNDTLVRNIKTFPAGCYSEVYLDSINQDIKFTKYWDFPINLKTNKKKKKDNEKEFEYIFEAAVKRQLIGEANFGGFLSGGIDSSLIAYYASRNMEKFRTYNVAFNFDQKFTSENFVDESFFAQEFSKNIKSQHTTIRLNWMDVPNSLSPIAKSLEEPKVGQCYPNFYAAKRASLDSRVVFSGTGGDEIFGGYPWRYSLNTKYTDWDSMINDTFLNKSKLIDHENEKIFLSSIDFGDRNRTKDIFAEFFSSRRTNEINQTTITESLMYFDSKTFLSGLLLVEDKLGMAHGLETRFPFLDNEIVDFGWNLSIDEKVKKNKVSGELQGKVILRRVAAGLLSDEIAFRSKSGFSGPDAHWFKHELGAYMKNFFDEKNVIWEFLDKNESLKYYIEHVEGKKNRRLFLWSVLYLNSLIREIWES